MIACQGRPMPAQPQTSADPDWQDDSAPKLKASTADHRGQCGGDVNVWTNVKLGQPGYFAHRWSSARTVHQVQSVVKVGQLAKAGVVRVGLSVQTGQ
jgi:hypothetical protein